MSTLGLHLAAAPDFDLDMRGVTPDALKSRKLNDIRRLRLKQGRRDIALGELFEIDGAPGADILEITGACPRLHHLGAGMTVGELRVTGDCGAWLGAEMRGGRLLVRGNAGDGVGAGMRNGLIDVSGSIGDFAGAAVPGAVSGMKGGTILVGRHAGRRVGDRMRRGLVVVAGDAGAGCGSQMIAGSIVVLGTTGPDLGAGMRRGTIALFGAPSDLGVNFLPNGRYELAFTQLLLRHVASLKPAWRARLSRVASVERWVGDAGASGLGEILFIS
ncbi:MAG TPA: formylmethanofuran dehydrogenase subunit C [Gammaproteobacteria bacterium]|nr:formylmethanofuran dehydrogenase subunit C [Gammaproteobacteria bacterium]